MTDEARLADAVARVESQVRAGGTLTPAEARAWEALTDANDAERAARDAFASFYSALPSTSDGPGTLPPEVAGLITRWTEARRRWDEASAALLVAAPAAPRRGPRLRVRPPATVRIPTPASARDTLALLFSPDAWKALPGGDALIAQTERVQVRVELDAGSGLSAERAVEQIARHGASAAQTFLALAAFWHERCGEQSPDTYLTVYASDILRFQGRKETPRGGYHRDELHAKGRDLFFLSRIFVPTSTSEIESDGRTTRTTALHRLLSLDALESVDSDGGGRGAVSIVRFRYHLGREVHAWLADPSRSVAVSSKLLGYHPQRQKYQILLGFCLACLSAAPASERRRISLPTLLSLAGIEVPEKRVAAFLTTLEDAFADLARDGVAPGLKLVKPDGWHEQVSSRRTGEVLEGSVVELSPAIAGSD